MITATRTEQDRSSRLRWFKEARFGMFVHWGLYSQFARHEWAMHDEHMPRAEYERAADTWAVKPHPMREWARLAKAAGMKYMVMTAKHHEGFCLWDTKQTDFNAVRRTPGRDLVAEYVEACREQGLKVGLYYSLMDWRHPDGVRCAYDEKARRRFLDFTQGCVRELMSNYGKIDILWYDVAWPLNTPEQWESIDMNAMVRRLQPHILINNRSYLPEDFGTPEDRIAAEANGRAWEACMTFNGSWGWFPTPEEDWHSTRAVLRMLRECAGGGGNLLLNVGPLPDGSLPELAVQRLRPVGRWLRKYGEAVYGNMTRLDGRFPVHHATPGTLSIGDWTVKGRVGYFWVIRWPGGNLGIGGLKTKVLQVTDLASQRPVRFEQTPERLVLKGLPRKSPDSVAQMAVYRIQFSGIPRQDMDMGYERLPKRRVRS